VRALAVRCGCHALRSQVERSSARSLCVSKVAAVMKRMCDQSA
jgi:hypothetical protein